MAAAQHRNRPVFMYQAVAGCFVLMTMTLMGCSPSVHTSQQVTPPAPAANESLSSASTLSSESAESVAASASSIESTSVSSTSSQATSFAAITSSAHSSGKSQIAATSSSTSPATIASASAELAATSKPASVTSNVSQPVSSSVTASSLSQPSAALEKPSPHASLDLDSLEQRLRDTKAIGVFTKLSLKNQVDDLLDSFRAYYKGKAKPQLPDLRQRYDLLLMKLLTLLQDDDPPLAADIRSSREAIWDILKDPEQFAKIS